MPVLSPLLVACFGPLFLSVALSIAFAVLDFSSVLVKMARDLKALRQEIAGLRPVEDFVKASKAQRRVIAMEKSIATETALHQAQWHQKIPSQLRPVAATLLLCWVFWGNEAIPLPSGWAAPVARGALIDTDAGADLLLPTHWIAMCQMVVAVTVPGCVRSLLEKRVR